MSPANRQILVLICASLLTLSPPLHAQTAPAAARSSLRELSASLEQLTNEGLGERRAGDGDRLRPNQRGGRRQRRTIIGRQRSLGLGVILSEDGYIVTNAHVVAGAQRVQVICTGPDRRCIGTIPHG